MQTLTWLLCSCVEEQQHLSKLCLFEYKTHFMWGYFQPNLVASVQINHWQPASAINWNLSHCCKVCFAFQGQLHWSNCVKINEKRWDGFDLTVRKEKKEKQMPSCVLEQVSGLWKMAALPSSVSPFSCFLSNTVKQFIYHYFLVVALPIAHKTVCLESAVSLVSPPLQHPRPILKVTVHRRHLCRILNFINISLLLETH